MFRTRLDEARTARTAGAAAGEHAALTAALALWRGPFRDPVTTSLDRLLTAHDRFPA